MRIEDIANVLGKSRTELEDMFKKNDVIELNLNDLK